MKKIVFIYLLLSFFVSPFFNIMENGCHEKHDSHLCQMMEDAEEHEQGSNHCQGCHLSINYPQIQTFSFYSVSKGENAPMPEEVVSIFNISNNLYRPPIV